MECIAETGFLPFFGGESPVRANYTMLFGIQTLYLLDWLQVHVVVQVQVVEILERNDCQSGRQCSSECNGLTLR